MQEIFKSWLGLYAQLQKNSTDWLQYHPAMTIADAWADSPLGEYYCDLLLDLWLKMYYWPMFMVGQESQTTEWLNQLLTGNLCSPGSVSRPTTQAAEHPDTV